MITRSQPMPGQRPAAMTKISESLPGRIIAVILATLVVSGLAYLVYRANQGIVPAVLQWVLTGAIGLAAGFAGRYYLSSRTLMLRLTTVFLALLIGLLFLGLVSRGMLGAQTPRNGQAGLNLGWLGQFILASVVAWLSLAAWRISPQAPSKSSHPRAHPGRSTAQRRSTNASPKKTRSGQPNKSRPARQPQAVPPESKPNLPAIARPEYWTARWEKLHIQLRRWWDQGIPTSPSPSAARLPTIHSPKKMAVRVQVKRARRIASPKPQDSAVRLVGKEEHRCPFCLEEVVPNDPRGVKICPVCHTRHHADCWDVTGVCQVPHIHE